MQLSRTESRLSDELLWRTNCAINVSGFLEMAADTNFPPGKRRLLLAKAEKYERWRLAADHEIDKLLTQIGYTAAPFLKMLTPKNS